MSALALMLQGCAQCADSVRAMPTSAQHGYRDAVLLMMSAGAIVFGAVVWMMRKNSE